MKFDGQNNRAVIRVEGIKRRSATLAWEDGSVAAGGVPSTAEQVGPSRGESQRCDFFKISFLSQERRYASSSFRGQHVPHRRRQIAHRGIRANAPGRTAPRTRFSAIRRVPPIYEPYREWDIERAFRRLKTIDLHLRPIFRWNADRVRAHLLLCMLALYVEHHMRRRLAPMLFDDAEHEAAAPARASIVAKSRRSQAAKDKDASKMTPDGLPVHSLRTLLADLATFARLEAAPAANENYVFTLYTRPTPLQSRAFDLLGVNPERSQ